MKFLLIIGGMILYLHYMQSYSNKIFHQLDQIKAVYATPQTILDQY